MSTPTSEEPKGGGAPCLGAAMLCVGGLLALAYVPWVVRALVAAVQAPFELDLDFAFEDGAIVVTALLLSCAMTMIAGFLVYGGVLMLRRSRPNKP